jgi:hypothetical protein
MLEEATVDYRSFIALTRCGMRIYAVSTLGRKSQQVMVSDS